MAYANDQLKLALGRRQAMWIKKQTARGELAEPAAADTVLFTSGGSFKQQYEYHEDKQKRDTRDELRGIKGILPHGEFDFTAYMKPSGTAGTAPEIADVLEGCFGSQASGASDTVQAAPSPTTTGCTVTDGTRFTVGQARLIPVGSGLELVTIDTVVVNAITWEPALSAAPASSATIGAAIQWKPATELSDYTIFLKDDDTVYAFQDCGIGKLSGKVDGKNPLELSASGGFIKFYMAGTDGLGAAMDASQTTITVKDGNKYIPGAGCIAKIESEIIKITARSGNTLTVQRGYMSTTAATHAIDTAITPWTPTITETGTLVHGKLGKPKWKLGGTWEDLPITEFDWEIDNAFKWLDDEKNGEGISAGFLAAGARKVTGTVRFLYRQKHSNLYALSDADTVAKVLVPVGTASGKTWVFQFNQADFLRPDKSGDEERLVEVALRVYATTAYNDSFMITQL